MNILNQVILVGRLVKDPELRDTENSKKISYITVAVPRSFKDANGEYQTDFINVTLSQISEYSGNISTSTSRIVFLCQGALSITNAYFFPAGAGWTERNKRMESIVVS